MIIKGGNLLNRIFTLVIYITAKKGVVNIGAVALTNFKKLMRSPFFMSFQVYKLIFINKCPKKVYTKKALNGFCKAILIFLNLCTF